MCERTDNTTIHILVLILITVEESETVFSLWSGPILYNKRMRDAVFSLWSVPGLYNKGSSRSSVSCELFVKVNGPYSETNWQVLL
jgi:hypothetical protein